MGSLVMAHEKGSNVDWIGDGVFRYKCPDANHRANALVVMEQQGNPNPTSVEFSPGTLDALGPVVVSVDGVPSTVVAPAVSLDETKLSLDIANVLIASNTNGLTAADHDAVVADVKKAIREGVGI